MAAVVCGGVQWVVMRWLIPRGAPACTAQGGLPVTPVDGGEQPGWHLLPALVASHRFGVVFLKIEFIRKDVSAPMCQVAVSPLALLGGFPLSPPSHTASMDGGASLNCPPELWWAKALLQPPVCCGCAESDHPLVLILLCPLHVHLGKKEV